ncbi:hypothetical protein [Streptomyces sp. NPDC020983]|uniref:hypothetical protein n=1 Tax=Streptomyces sp. NPDC020983 TaxID=3365106 RepID=UPI00379967F1
MTLSTDVIFDRLNTYFQEKFGMAEGAQTIFRFDKRGSVISDQDFVDPRNPAAGCVPALAVEKFSDLANRIPLVCDDGFNVLLTQNSTDQTYFYRLLSPSVPYVPDGADPMSRTVLTDAFNAAKAEALRVWNAATLESLSGMMLAYKPAIATPEGWYDRSRDDIWSNESFEVSDDAAAAPPGAPDSDLWKITATDPVIPVPAEVPAAPDASDTALHDWLGQLRADPRPLPLAAEPEQQPAADASSTLVLSPSLLDNLDVRDRLLVSDMTADQVDTRPLATNAVTISFDYCVVTVRRPWWFDAFVNGGNWYVPGLAEGALTMEAAPGNMPFVTTGMVVVRNLVITGSWDPLDIESASRAVGFGPFKVSGGITDGKLTHPLIQTIGWLLESQPALPPCEPQPAAAAPQP